MKRGGSVRGARVGRRPVRASGRAACIAIVGCLVLCAGAVAQSADDRARRRTVVVEVFERCRDAVVNISTTRIREIRSPMGGSFFDDIFNIPRGPIQQRVQSVGSGFLIHETGIIVTNAHVVVQASDVVVTFADKTAERARIVAIDTEHDLAILRIDTRRSLPYIRLGRSDDIMIGETVIAIGNPLGLQHTVTSGIVSALNRELQFARDMTYTGLIQTDAAINPGNSGGPLLNANGELIGVNTAIRGDAQNVGFAIPVDRLWELLPSMLDIERRQRVRFGLLVGGANAEVRAVRQGTPAAAAGMQLGDRILAFNGHPIRDSIDFYVHLLDQRPGQQVDLALQRRNTTTTAKVALEVVPPPDGAALADKLLGVKITPIPDAAQRRYELPPEAGVWVDEVRRGSPADEARIRPGDLLLRVNRVEVTSITDVGLALEGVQPGASIQLGGYRLRTDSPFPWMISIRTQSER